MKGKSMILNTIGASGLWYTATVLTLPGWVHTKVNRIIWDFLWAGKTEVVKRDTCILPQNDVRQRTDPPLPHNNIRQSNGPTPPSQ